VAKRISMPLEEFDEEIDKARERGERETKRALCDVLDYRSRNESLDTRWPRILERMRELWKHSEGERKDG
jgi:hypothetical protein